MAEVSITKTSSGIELNIRAIVTRGKSLSSYLNRYIYPKYKQAQLTRWQTENSSQTGQWKALSMEYEKRKKKKFAAYPGAGNALMIATGRLAGASQGNSAGALKLITDKQMVVGVDSGVLPYAAYPGVERPYMTFNEDTIQDWTDGIAKYVMTGDVT